MTYGSDNTEKHNFKEWNTQNNYTHSCQLLSLSPSYEVYIVRPIHLYRKQALLLYRLNWKTRLPKLSRIMQIITCCKDGLSRQETFENSLELLSVKNDQHFFYL